MEESGTTNNAVMQRQEEANKAEPKGAVPEKMTLLDLVYKHSQFFHTPDGVAYVAVNTKGYREVWPINSQEFESIVVRIFYDQFEGFPSKKELRSTIHDLTWMARIEGPQREVFIRYAKMDGVIYIDLANDNWLQVKITTSGYEVIPSSESPAHFIRTPAMLALPRPMPGQTLEVFRPFMNVGSDDDFILTVAFMLSAMYPHGPFPILIFNGSHGSAKSTATRMICDCIDPNKAVLRSLPNSERDLVIAASNSHVQSFDNVSTVSNKQSDGFCRLSTGSGFRTRKLYTNNLETILNPKRPMILNGISYFATQNDLLDRAIIINLPPISENRRPESELKKEWARKRPFIIGALCDALSTALKNFDKVTVPNLPRMADFVRLLTASEPSLPCKKGGFIKAYEANCAESVNYALEADPVAEIILKLLDKHGDLSVTFSDLLEMMNNAAPKSLKKLKEWPKAANILSNRLMRLEGFLRSKGIEITREPRKADKRIVRIKKISQSVPLAINLEEKTPKSTLTSNIKPYVELWKTDKSVGVPATEVESEQLPSAENSISHIAPNHPDVGVSASEASFELKETDDVENADHVPPGGPAIVQEYFADGEKDFEEGII